MNKILVVEDDENLSLLYKSILEKNNFTVFCAANGIEALDILEQHYIDLIISDIMMPDMDGFEFAQSLRDANYQTPIMLITAKDSFTDKKRGFDLGVDDYMVKPIDVNEMVLRVDALLRRAQIAHNKELIVGSTALNQETFQVTWHDQAVLLPQKEFLLLFKLLSYPDKIFTRHQLMEEIWGPDSDSEERTIDVHIKRLRARFQSNPDFEIVTIRGLGYKAAIAS